MAVKFNVPALIKALAVVEPPIQGDYDYLQEEGFIFDAAFLELSAEHKDSGLKDTVTLQSSVVTIMKHPNNTAITYGPALLVKDFLKTLKKDYYLSSPQKDPLEVLFDTGPFTAAVECAPALSVTVVDHEFGIDYYKHEANQYKVAKDAKAQKALSPPAEAQPAPESKIAAFTDEYYKDIEEKEVAKALPVSKVGSVCTTDLVSAPVQSIAEMPTVFYCGYPPKGFPVNSTAIPQSTVADAEKLLSPCFGTSPTSTYHLVAKAGPLRVAARVKHKGKSVSLSLRAEGASLRQRVRLLSVGFKVNSGASHLSVHFEGTEVTVRSAYAALLLGCGLHYDQVILLGDLSEGSK